MDIYTIVIAIVVAYLCIKFLQCVWNLCWQGIYIRASVVVANAKGQVTAAKYKEMSTGTMPGMGPDSCQV